MGEFSILSFPASRTLLYLSNNEWIRTRMVLLLQYMQYSQPVQPLHVSDNSKGLVLKPLI